jgi:hypothetical protein
MLYITVGDDHVVVRADLFTWARWHEDVEGRRVGRDCIGDVRISTVCLGVDHRCCGGGPPLIFETLISGGELDGEMWRCSTWDDAEIGHRMAVKRVSRSASAEGK